MNNFSKLLNSERNRIHYITNGRNIYNPWLPRLSSIRVNIIAKYKRKAWESNTFVTTHINWNEFLVYSYRNLVVKNVGHENINSEWTFDKTILIWHNRLRGYYNGKGLKQERKRGKELTQDERKWHIPLMKLYNSLIQRNRNIGWNKTIGYSTRYIRKAEKKKLGGKVIQPEPLKDWSKRFEKIRDGLKRKIKRQEKGWYWSIERTYMNLVTREKIRLGVLNHE